MKGGIAQLIKFVDLISSWNKKEVFWVWGNSFVHRPGVPSVSTVTFLDLLVGEGRSCATSLQSHYTLNARGISHSVFDNQPVSNHCQILREWEHGPWLGPTSVEGKCWHFIHADFELDGVDNGFWNRFPSCFTAFTYSCNFRAFRTCGYCFPMWSL